MSFMPSDEDRQRSVNRSVYTLVSDDVRQYDLSVRVPRHCFNNLNKHAPYGPWIRIVADRATGDIHMAAGVRPVQRDQPEDDGA